MKTVNTAQKFNTNGWHNTSSNDKLRWKSMQVWISNNDNVW